MNDRESRLTSFAGGKRQAASRRFRYWLTFAVAWATLQRATTPLGDRSGKAVTIGPFTIRGRATRPAPSGGGCARV